MSKEYEELLNEFLNRWPLKRVEEMKLEDYALGLPKEHPNYHDTFYYWLEYKTVGGIGGGDAFKSVIYYRNSKNPKKEYSNCIEDNGYLFKEKYGKNKDNVFEYVKQNILKVIGLSMRGEFEKIESIELPDTLKWKTAFLYSNEKLIPIFKKEVLIKIAKSLESKTKRISEIQKIMIKNKPQNLTAYQYGCKLWKEFGSEIKTLEDLNDNEEKAVYKSLSDSAEQRRKRLSEKENELPQKKGIQVESFIRDPDVIATVLENAKGICAKCQKEAPFVRERGKLKGQQYLEIHHKIWLSESGKDTVENAVALCPNCHREEHYGKRHWKP